MVRCSVNPMSSVLLNTALCKGTESAQHKDSGTQRAGADGSTRRSPKPTLSNPTASSHQSQRKVAAEGPVQNSSANAALLPSCSPGCTGLLQLEREQHHATPNTH